MDTPIRAQVKPTAGSKVILYQANASTILSTIVACNLGRFTDYIRIAKVLGGEAESDKQYLRYDVAVPPGAPYAITEGEVLIGDDAIWVYSRNGNVSFNLSGVQTA